jgi:copper chaperone NosL
MNRRSFLASAVVGLSSLSAGCLGAFSGESESKPDPIALSGTKKDDQGGMIIGDHGGPNGQIFYENNEPEGHDNPAWFHTLTYGLFPYYHEHEEMGWTATAVYVTDYSIVEFEAPSSGSFTLPAPTEAETFGDATEMAYVVESAARGGMGPAIVPFSKQSDADSFVAAHGGELLSFEDISLEFVRTYQRSG